MKRATISSLILLLSACSLLTAVPRIGRAQSHIIRGRFDSPPRGHVLPPYVPVTISWAIDDAADVDAQDLILSTDGGTTFKIKIVAHLPREQRQLIWGTGPANATGRARLKLVLHSINGEVEEVIGDDFSISPFPRAPTRASASAQDLDMYDAHSKSATAADAQEERDNNNDSSTGGDAADKVEVTPSFANPGSCTTAEVPVLNYNMNHPTPCFPYNGEPALAQDPTNPKRFFIVTGLTSEISSTAQWAFSGSSTATAFNFGNGIQSRGDLTVEVGSDGTVYAAALAQSAGFPDIILIFRSKNHGVSFEPGVAVPNIPVGQFVDKPVLAVNPLDSETLVITFNISLTPGSRVAICKQASTGVLSIPNIWGISIPRSQFGGDLSDQGSTHPLIDPIDSNSFRLFVVQTNYTYSQTEAGYAVYQYQLSKGQLALNNANLQRILPAEVLVNGSPVGAQHWTINSSHQAIEDALRVSQGTSNYTKAAIDYCDPSAHRMYIPTLVNTTNNPSFPDARPYLGPISYSLAVYRY